MAVITVSRQLSCGAHAACSEVAKTLGYELVDRDALVASAARFGVAQVPPKVPEIEEIRPSFWERLNEERTRYSMLLRCLVYDFAARDNVIILGRGAAYLLRGVAHVLRVLMVAPRETRVERFMSSPPPGTPVPLTRERVIELLRQSDRERSGYIRYMHHVDWMDPTLYDLIVNTGQLTVETAAHIVVQTIERPEFETTSLSKQKVQSLALASRIEVALLNDPRLWVQSLKVQVSDGAATLYGYVLTEEERETAEELVLAMPGVNRVIDEIRIQPPPLTGM